MPPEVAAAVIRYVVHRHGKKTISFGKRVMMGITAPQIERKKVLISSDILSDDDPFVGWWTLINQPAGKNDILLQELKGVILAHVDPGGRLASAMGGPVASLHAANSRVGQMQTVGAMADGSMAASIYNRWNDAWKAGVWSSAVGGRQEFSIGMDYYLLGGCCTMAADATGKISGGVRLWGDKSEMIQWMGIAEKQGRGGPAVKYTKTLCDNSSALYFEYAPSTSRVSMTKKKPAFMK